MADFLTRLREMLGGSDKPDLRTLEQRRAEQVAKTVGHGYEQRAPTPWDPRFVKGPNDDQGGTQAQGAAYQKAQARSKQLQDFQRFLDDLTGAADKFNGDDGAVQPDGSIKFKETPR
jgi:hypothetical protein